MPIRVEIADGRSFEVDTDDPQLAALAGRRFLAKERGDMQPQLPVAPAPMTDMPGMPPAGPVGGPDVLSTATAAAPPAAAFPEPPAPPAPPPKSTPALLAQAAGRAAGDTINFPLDLAYMVPNAALAAVDAPANVANKFGANFTPPTRGYRLGWGEQNVLPSQASANSAGAAAESLGFPLQETDPHDLSFGENTAYNATRGAAAAGLTGLLLRKWGLSRAPSAFPRAFDDLLKAYKGGGYKAVGGDVAAGAGAGTGLSVMQQAPDEVRNSGGGVTGFLMDLIGQLAGGVGTSTLYTAGANGPRAVADRFNRQRPARDIPFDANGNPTTNRVADTTAEWLQGLTKTPEQDATNIRTNADWVRSVGPNPDGSVPMPSTFLMADNPHLEGLDQTLRSRKPGTFIESDNNVREGARNQVAQTQVPGAPTRTFPDTARDIGEQQIATTQQQAQSARDAAVAAELQARQEASGVRDASTGEAQSRAAVAADQAYVDRGYLPARTEKNALFNEAPGRADVIDASPIIDTARELRGRVNALGPERSQLPAEFVQRIERLAPDAEPPGPGTVQVGDLVDVRKYLATATQKARAAGNFDLVDNLNRLRNQINQTIENHPGLAEANQNYRENFAPTYRPGPNDPAAKFTQRLDRDPTRSGTPPAETVPGFLAEGEQGAQALRRGLTREDAQASEALGAPAPGAGTEAVTDWMMGDMAKRGAIGPNGRLSEAGLQKWRRDNADTLAAFPEMHRRIDQMIERAQRGDMEVNMAQSTVRDRETAAATARHDATSGHLGMASDADPHHAVGNVLNSQDPVRNVERLKRDLTARDVERAATEVQTAQEELRLAISQSTARNPRRTQAYRDAQQGVADAQLTLNEARAGRGEASASMRNATADWLYNKVTTATASGDDAVRAGELAKVLRDKRDALSRAGFTAEDMNHLQTGQRFLEFLARRANRATVGSPTAENVGRSDVLIEAAMKLWYGGLKGGNRYRNFKLLSTKFLKPGMSETDAMWELATRAATDPQLGAQLLSREVKPAPGPAYNPDAARALRRVQAGRGVYGDNQDDDQQ